MGYKIGIDAGGTKLESVLLKKDGTELFRKRIPTPVEDGYAGIRDAVYSLCVEAAEQIPAENNYTIGIGIPGTINSETGLVQNANTTCLIGKPFQKHLEDLLKRPITMENDANCFTLAESSCGAAKGFRLVFGVIIGTGCGGGLCIDGHMRCGNHGIAGEWGHFSVDPEGAECYCGNRGCVETKISGSGVEAAFYSKYGKRMNMADIVSGYRNKDFRCSEIFEQFLDDFGRCLGGLISVLDPDAVVLGGGLSNIRELYDIGIKHIQRYAFHDSVRTPVLKNKLGDSAGVLGAAWIGV